VAEPESGGERSGGCGLLAEENTTRTSAGIRTTDGECATTRCSGSGTGRTERDQWQSTQ
jgi:hypothetical protein